MAEIKNCVDVTHLASSLYIYDVLIIHVWHSSIDEGQRKPYRKHVLNFRERVSSGGFVVHNTSTLKAGTSTK